MLAAPYAAGAQPNVSSCANAFSTAFDQVTKRKYSSWQAAGARRGDASRGAVVPQWLRWTRSHPD
jgi:hypothetical protein